MIIKVCGMREQENIKEVEALDVDFLGFIFYSGSPRYIVDNRESLEIVRRCTKPKVGVFVNETFDNIMNKAELCSLDYLQLHGNETPGLCMELRRHGYSLIKAFSIAAANDFVITENYSDCCDYFLFDTKYTGFGGSGKRFDWFLLDEYNGKIPFLLSGGLTTGCDDDIIQLKHSQFAGIDLNSGFEVSPARKDIDKLKIIINHVRKPDNKNQIL